LAARLQFLKTPEHRDHLLTHLVAVAPAFDDLQIGTPSRGLAAEIQLRMLVRAQSRDSLGKINLNQLTTWHYTFAKGTPHHKQHQ
jgi:hypothetical protein